MKINQTQNKAISADLILNYKCSHCRQLIKYTYPNIPASHYCGKCGKVSYLRKPMDAKLSIDYDDDERVKNNKKSDNSPANIQKSNIDEVKKTKLISTLMSMGYRKKEVLPVIDLIYNGVLSESDNLKNVLVSLQR